MKVSLKEEYKGQLGIAHDPLTGEFNYILTHYTYPSYEMGIVQIEEGDELTVRSPVDGSILIHRLVELEYDSHLVMDIDTGVYHQMLNGYRLNGLMTNIEPMYWFGFFLQNYQADLIKSV